LSPGRTPSISGLILRDLARWRRLAEIVAGAVKSVNPDAKVYVAGGAAENRLTVLSDIDVVVVLPREPDHGERIALMERVFEEAEKRGLPLHAPIELHVIGPEKLRELREKSRIVEITVAREDAETA